MCKNAVVFCVKGPHIQLTAVAILSIVKKYHNKDDLKILIVLDSVYMRDIEFIRKIPQMYGKNNITVDAWNPGWAIKKISKGFSLGKDVNVPPMAVWRLFMPDQFKEYTRLLYLDNDVIVNCDVLEIFQLLSSDCVLSAVPDFYFSGSNEYTNNKEKEAIYGIPDMNKYFNNGMMLINVEKYNELISPEKLLDMINNNHYYLADQTIINILSFGKVQYLPWKYNYQHDLQWINDQKNFDPNKKTKMVQDYYDIKVRHFAGATGGLLSPYEHVECFNRWDIEFWRLFATIKELSLLN